MKAGKKIITLLAVGAMTVSTILSGCGGEKTQQGASEKAGTTTEAENKEIPTIKMTTYCTVDPTDTEMVQEELSMITREKIGCNVEIIPVQIGNMNSQMSLLLAGGDNAVDVYLAGGWSTLGGVADNGQAIVLDKYLAPYEDEIKAAIGEDVYKCGEVNGSMYGIPRYLDFASGLVYMLRKDIADEYGISNGDKMSFDELTDLFEKLKQEYPDKALAGTVAKGFANSPLTTSVNDLGDSNILGALLEGDDEHVVNYYETDEYAKLIQYFKKWKDIGITMADPLNVVELPSDYLTNGKALGLFGKHFDAALDAEYASKNYGVDMTGISITDRMKQSPTLWFCVSSTCEYPQEATALIYLMATDPDVENLLCNGIEGVHYQLAEDGTAHYMDGKDQSSTGWPMGMSWVQLNSTLSHPFEYPADYFEDMIKSNNETETTKAFGFQFDPSPVANEISACANVVAQYRAALEVGVPDDMDATYEEFKQALKDAGIDAVVAEKQKQLDAYEGNN